MNHPLSEQELNEQLKAKLIQSGKGATVKLHQQLTGSTFEEATKYVDELENNICQKVKKETEKTNLKFGIFFTTFLTIAIIGAIVGLYFWTAKQMSPVPISNISWTEIDSIYGAGSKYTDLQKNEEWKKYQGKRVSWRGTVMSISKGIFGVKLSVKMRTLTIAIPDVDVLLKSDQKDNALALKEGDHVTFRGTLDRWGTIMPISLADGEIISVPK